MYLALTLLSTRPSANAGKPSPIPKSDSQITHFKARPNPSAFSPAFPLLPSIWPVTSVPNRDREGVGLLVAPIIFRKLAVTASSIRYNRRPRFPPNPSSELPHFSSPVLSTTYLPKINRRERPAFRMNSESNAFEHRRTIRHQRRG